MAKMKFMKKIKKHHNLKNIDRTYGGSLKRLNGTIAKVFPDELYKRALPLVTTMAKRNFDLFAQAETLRVQQADESFKKVAYQHLCNANECAVAQFTLAINLGSPVQFNLLGHEFEVIAPNETFFTTVDTWFKALGVSLLLRDESSTQALLRYQAKDTVITNEKPCEFEQALCDFIKGIFDSNVNIQGLFLTLVEQSANGSIQPPTRQTFVDLCIMPVVMAWAALIENNMEVFEQRVHAATTNWHAHFHKSQWAEDSQTWFNPLLIAATVFAYDKYGYELKHDNPYIPIWIIKGEFD